MVMITDREYKILKMHWAGKRHSYIASRFDITKRDIANLILLTAKGYKIGMNDTTRKREEKEYSKRG